MPTLAPSSPLTLDTIRALPLRDLAGRAREAEETVARLVRTLSAAELEGEADRVLALLDRVRAARLLDEAPAHTLPTR